MNVRRYGFYFWMNIPAMLKVCSSIEILGPLCRQCPQPVPGPTLMSSMPPVPSYVANALSRSPVNLPIFVPGPTSHFPHALKTTPVPKHCRPRNTPPGRTTTVLSFYILVIIFLAFFASICMPPTSQIGKSLRFQFSGPSHGSNKFGFQIFCNTRF